ncbi:hypothetical protein KJ693_05985 [bacterium]|nr:hypothetical protein [bacterium]
MPRDNILKPRNLWWPFLILVLLLFHANHPFNSDEGIVLSGAWNLINGRKLYIDFFEFVAPGSFYLVFWAWKIFGVSYFVAKSLAIIIFFLILIGIYKISQEISKDKLNILPPLLFLLSSLYWPLINHNTFNIFFIVWATYFFLKGFSYNSGNNFTASGLFSGLAILFLQQRGIVLLFSFASFLLVLFLKEKKLFWLKANLYFILSSLLPLLAFLNWPLKILWEDLIVFPSANYMEVGKVPFSLLIIFLLVLYLMSWLFKEERSKKIWLLFYLQFLLLLSNIPRADIYHLSLTLFPLYSILPISFKKIIPLSPRAKKCYYLIIALIVLIIISRSRLIIYINPFFHSQKDSKVISYINDNCQDSKYIYAGPFIPGIYFETRRLNPSPYSFLITNHHTKEQFLEAREAIKRHRPSCAVLNYGWATKFNYDKNNPLDNYILDNYKLIFQDRGFLVYKISKALF